MPLIDLNGLGHFKDKENAMIANDYSASSTYAVGDYVFYNGTLYKCKTAITTAEAWTSGHWEAAVLTDAVSELNTNYTELQSAIDAESRTVDIENIRWINRGLTSSTGVVGGSINKSRLQTFDPIHVKKGSTIIARGDVTVQLCEYSGSAQNTFIKGWSATKTVTVDTDCYIRFVLRYDDNSPVSLDILSLYNFRLYDYYDFDPTDAKMPTSFAVNHTYTSANSATHELQSCCSDGTYIYYCMHGALDSDNSVVGKVDKSGVLQIEKTDRSYGHANDIAYYPIDNTIRITALDTDNTVYILDADTLDYISSYSPVTDTVKQQFANMALSSFTRISGIAYVVKSNIFAYLISSATNGMRGILFADANNTPLYVTVFKPPFDSTFGGISSFGEYLGIGYQGGPSGAYFSGLFVLNLNGQLIDIIDYQSALADANSLATLEAVCDCGDGVFAIANSNDNLHICTSNGYEYFPQFYT